MSSAGDVHLTTKGCRVATPVGFLGGISFLPPRVVRAGCTIDDVPDPDRSVRTGVLVVRGGMYSVEHATRPKTGGTTLTNIRIPDILAPAIERAFDRLNGLPDATEAAHILSLLSDLDAI